MEGKAQKLGEPGHDLWALVGAEVVKNDINDPADENLRIDGVQEADEVMMAMTLRAVPDHFRFGLVDGGEQRHPAVPFAVVDHGPVAALLQLRSGLGAVEFLDLRLLGDYRSHLCPAIAYNVRRATSHMWRPAKSL